MTFLHTLQIKVHPLDSLAPYARNPKRHGEEQIGKLVASLREFGWTFPVLTDETGEIIAGHGRLLAAQLEHASFRQNRIQHVVDSWHIRHGRRCPGFHRRAAKCFHDHAFGPLASSA